MIKNLAYVLIIIFTFNVSQVNAYDLLKVDIDSLMSSDLPWIPLAIGEEKQLISIAPSQYQAQEDGSFLAPYQIKSKWFWEKSIIGWFRLSCADDEIMNIGVYTEYGFDIQASEVNKQTLSSAKSFFCPVKTKGNKRLLFFNTARHADEKSFLLEGFYPEEFTINEQDNSVRFTSYFFELDGKNVPLEKSKSYFVNCLNSSIKDVVYESNIQAENPEMAQFKGIVSSVCRTDDSMKNAGFIFNESKSKIFYINDAPRLRQSIEENNQKYACNKIITKKFSFSLNGNTIHIDEICEKPVSFTLFLPTKEIGQPIFSRINCQEKTIFDTFKGEIVTSRTFNSMFDQLTFGCKKVTEFIFDQSRYDANLRSSVTSSPLPEIKPIAMSEIRPIKEKEYKPLKQYEPSSQYLSLKKNESSNTQLLHNNETPVEAKSHMAGAANFEKICLSLGFKPKATAFNECVLKLNVALNNGDKFTNPTEVTPKIKGDGSNNDQVCQKYGYQVGEESYKKCRLDLDIAQTQADLQIARYEAQLAQFEEQKRQYEEQKTIYEAAIEEQRLKKEREKNMRLLTFGLGLVAGKTIREAAPALAGKPMLQRSYPQPPAPPLEPMFNDVELITPNGYSRYCSFNSSRRVMDCR